MYIPGNVVLSLAGFEVQTNFKGTCKTHLADEPGHIISDVIGGFGVFPLLGSC